MNSLLDCLILPASLLVGIFFIYLYYISIVNQGSSKQDRPNCIAQGARPKHTFTNNEILSPGIDIRREDHRQQILDNRRREKEKHFADTLKNERINRTIEAAEKIAGRK
jgi:hypothetical protein